MTTSDPWAVRPYDPTLDEAGVVYLWLKAFAHSSFGRARGAQVDGSDAERAYWAEHRPVVEHLLRTADTRVLCDPEEPTVIWAFVCTSGDSSAPVVHYGVVKRRFREATTDIYAALLGDRLSKPCTYTHCLQGSGLLVPSSWTLNPYSVLLCGGGVK